MRSTSPRSKGILAIHIAIMWVLSTVTTRSFATAFVAERIIRVVPAFVEVSGGREASAEAKHNPCFMRLFSAPPERGRPEQPKIFQNKSATLTMSRTTATNQTSTRTVYTPQRRRFSTAANEDRQGENSWKVPDHVAIPEDQLDISFVRSSGAGGQNVNKVSSCVQVRFHVLSAGWMPLEVRQRFCTLYAGSISKEGVYSTESQEHRTQVANRKQVMTKLQKAVLAAWPRPKIRKIREGLSEHGKEIRKQDKQKHKMKKESRRSVDY